MSHTLTKSAASSSDQRQDMKLQVYVVILSAFAAFGGLMFGYDIGVINGVKDMNGFRSRMNLSLTSNASCNGGDEEENAILGLIVSVFSLGCFVGALCAGVLSDGIGRKIAIMCGGVIFFIGGAVQAASFFTWMVLLGRIIAGMGVGILSMVVPVYNAELSPPSLRGRLVSLAQLFITLGIMVSFVVSLACNEYIEGWRIALGLQCVLAAVLIIGMLFLPETPRWLVKRGKSDKAFKVLSKIRQGADEEEVKQELSDIKQSLQTGTEFTLVELFREVFTWKIMQRIFIGVLLQMFQQLTGMNVIMYYSTSIFCSVSVSSYVSTAIVGTINFLTTLIAVFLVDKIGRKALLLVGAIGMLASIVGAGVVIQATGVDKTEQHIAAGYAVVILICFFVFNFAYSWGPVAWVVTSEIFPLKVRGIAVSLTTSANWIGNFIIAMVTPLLLGSSLGTAGTFYILGGVLLASLIFVLLTLPETKGVSLEKMEELFEKPWLKRVKLLYYLRCGCPWVCCKRSESRDLFRVKYSTVASSDQADKKALMYDEGEETQDKD